MFNRRHALLWMFAAVLLYGCWASLEQFWHFRSLKAENGPLYILTSPLVGLIGYLARVNRQRLLARGPHRTLVSLIAGYIRRAPQFGKPNTTPVPQASSEAPAPGHVGLARHVRITRPSKRQVLVSMLWLCVGLGLMATTVAMQPLLEMGTNGHSIGPHEHEMLAIAATQFATFNAAVAFGVSIATLFGARKWSVPATVAIVAAAVGILLVVG